MIVAPGSRLWFETTSNDCGAVVVGPNVAKECKPGERLPTEERGFYTLSVIDRQKRTFGAALKGENANPREVSDVQKGRVVLDYRVEV